ncbi:unnamed protein product [Chrysoparadoxa australica]
MRYLFFLLVLCCCLRTTLGLRSKVALVTGGSRGIGAGICEFLAEAGINLVIAYNADEEAAQALSDRLAASYGVKCEVVGGDITLPQTRQRYCDKIDQAFDGRLDIFVCQMPVNEKGQYVGATSKNADGLH